MLKILYLLEEDGIKLIMKQLKPYVAYDTPKIKVPPPKMPELDFSKIEVPLEQIIFPLEYAKKMKKLEK